MQTRDTNHSLFEEMPLLQGSLFIHYGTFNTSLGARVNNCLNAAADANLATVENLLSHYPTIFYRYDNAIDESKREFQHVTLLQIALWSCNKPLLTYLLKFIEEHPAFKAELIRQYDEFEKNGGLTFKVNKTTTTELYPQLSFLEELENCLSNANKKTQPFDVLLSNWDGTARPILEKLPMYFQNLIRPPIRALFTRDRIKKQVEWRDEGVIDEEEANDKSIEYLDEEKHIFVTVLFQQTPILNNFRREIEKIRGALTSDSIHTAHCAPRPFG